MLYLLLYGSGVITTLVIVGLITSRIKISSLQDKLDSCNSTIKKLNNTIETQSTKIKELVDKTNLMKTSIESDKRLATLTWGGWHKENEPKVTWSVTFELREVALSEDESKSKFEVLSIVSENMKNESWGLQEYGDYFYKKTGGGWLDTRNPGFNKMKLTWVTTVSKAEARQRKIDGILNPDNNE